MSSTKTALSFILFGLGMYLLYVAMTGELGGLRFSPAEYVSLWVGACFSIVISVWLNKPGSRGGS
jgi:uncharacterized OsmC-like protein